MLIGTSQRDTSPIPMMPHCFSHLPNMWKVQQRICSIFLFLFSCLKTELFSQEAANRRLNIILLFLLFLEVNRVYSDNKLCEAAPG